MSTPLSEMAFSPLSASKRVSRKSSCTRGKLRMSPCDCKSAEVHCSFDIVSSFMPPRDEQLSNPPTALIVVCNIQNHNQLCVCRYTDSRSLVVIFFHFLFTRNSQDFLKKHPFFVVFWLIFQKSWKICKKTNKNACPRPEWSLISPASAPLRVHKEE